MSESLKLHRRSDGTITCQNPSPPDKLSLSNRWVLSGGIPGVLAAKRDAEAKAEAAGEDPAEAASEFNTTPLFTRDGTDLVFDFANHGEARYELLEVTKREHHFRLVQED